MSAALTELLQAIRRRRRSLLLWAAAPDQVRRHVPVPGQRRCGNAVTALDAVVHRLIVARRTAPNPEPRDLLDLLISARDEETGAGMDDRQVRDELMTFLPAGHETTANALAWAFSLLSARPETRERLCEEVDRVLGDRAPTAADADALGWTAAVVQEAMRLYPPAWTIERDAVAPDEIDGVRVGAGDTVVVSPYLIHRNPAHWPNPEGFDPRRFLPGARAERHRLAYLPFGAGRRQCVGAGFAMLEATLALAVITQRFMLDQVPGERPMPEPSITLRPHGGIRMVLRPR